MDPQQENNGFGPISKPRGKYASIAAALLAIVVAISALVLATVAHATEVREDKEKVLFVFFGIGLLVLSLAVGEIMQRLCLLLEEIRHKETRYHGSWRKVLNCTFAFTYLPLLSMEVSQINERENKNVADGLAWSYYFGYLKLVLPVLEDQISKSEDYRFKITKKKLFILLPKSCYTYKTIDKADPRVISDGNLPASERNRGGILKRVYMHTVHRVEMPLPDGDVEEPYYIILEYATPLMTLYDMSRNAEAGLSREQRDKQVVLFTRKLKEILDSCEECKGKYELVPISGELGQIADVLVQKLRDADVQVDPGSHAE